VSPPDAAAGRPIVVKGLSVAPGLAVGSALFHAGDDVDIPVRAIAPEDVAAEHRRLVAALRTARTQLEEVEERIGKEVGHGDARIFSVQGLLLEDPTFRKGVRRRIRHDLVNAEVAVRDEVADWERRFADVETGERNPAADLRDVGQRLLRVLLGRPRPRLGEADGADAHGERVILVTRELLPSDAAHLDRTRLAAIVTGSGGVASHAAILARGLGIPAVSNVDVTALPARGGPWIVDGTAGEVIVNAGARQLGQAERRSRDFLRFRSEMMAAARGLVTTADGAAIELQLNIENFETLPAEAVADLRGIGLYRTEFLFLHRESFPSEEEQFQHYVGALRRVRDREITFRTIDVGGDKPLPYLRTPAEPNPVLGWRGMRLSLEWPDMFYTQLRALLRASAHGRIRILLPMITMVEEFRRAREIVDQLQGDLARHAIPHDGRVPLGAMIEVPAAALGVRALAQEADFLSIGTNDLSQYALAVDRNNARVADLYQSFHPGLLLILRHVVEAADAAGTPVGLCGEMAGDPLATVLLMGLGLRSLSMSPYRVPLVKKIIGAVTLDDARAVAIEAQEQASTTDLKRLLRQRTLERVPDLEAWLTPG
jgi:phosphotransferase system enzyme I (PtsI)